MRPRGGLARGGRRAGPVRRAALDRRRRDQLQEGPQVHDRGGRPRPRKGRAGPAPGTASASSTPSSTCSRRGSAGIEVVTADGARWIADVVAERLPGAELAVDPFHAVSWATGASDELRRRSWREARSRPAPKRRRGRPRKGGQAPPNQAGLVKGLGSRCSRPRGPHGGAGLGALGAQGGRRAAVALNHPRFR